MPRGGEQAWRGARQAGHDGAGRPRSDLPRVPHGRRHQRRVRLPEVRPGHRRPGTWTGVRAGPSTIVGALMATSPALALAMMLFGPSVPSQGAAPDMAPPAAAAPVFTSVELPGASFEAVGQHAVKTRDIATLLSSFVEGCDGEKRDIDRSRCQATTAYLRRTLPQRTFVFTTDEQGVGAVSEYDASVKGYHVALAGCVACTKPITIGKTKEARLITLKVPEKDADSLAKAVALSRNTFGFDSFADAKR